MCAEVWGGEWKCGEAATHLREGRDCCARCREPGEQQSGQRVEEDPVAEQHEGAHPYHAPEKGGAVQGRPAQSMCVLGEGDPSEGQGSSGADRAFVASVQQGGFPPSALPSLSPPHLSVHSPRLMSTASPRRTCPPL